MYGKMATKYQRLIFETSNTFPVIQFSLFMKHMHIDVTMMGSMGVTFLGLQSSTSLFPIIFFLKKMKTISEKTIMAMMRTLEVFQVILKMEVIPVVSQKKRD
jgi:hypothetical protein